jgi:pimeloyl-[acyl-carrier protein] methyl ester esterase
MSVPRLVFYHGWGFDGAVWRTLLPYLAAWPQQIIDLGYYGTPSKSAETETPWIAVTHSYGTIRALRDANDYCLGLISINGFACFLEKEDYRPAVSRRVLDRMIARLEAKPRDVLAEFRSRCGGGPPPDRLELERLRDDLQDLADSDCRAQLAAFTGPVLQLAGSADGIVAPEMTSHAFAKARRLETAWLEGGDHLLPLSAPAWCYAVISAFLERLGSGSEGIG